MAVTLLDHVTTATRRLLWQFQDRPNLTGIVAAFARAIQDVEDALIAVHGITIDNAAGLVLDAEGSVVGERRLGRSDDDYRAAIKARVLINKGAGLIEDLIFVLLAALPGASVEILERTPAHVIAYLPVELGGAGDPAPGVLAALLDQATGAGIAHALIYGLVPDAERFRFATGDTPETDVNTGFANDAQTTGGYWADVAV